ncbi:TetR/AcrR family transcriptional regulator [Spirosoma panaciterrae]|uniref:TetR/AcrR family transcriptional regulator n=1 Tax=Spirosoma panaciterrae TaxID=496058 RepID=UPI00037E9980|nr:TetR/AcrR family transcriptional regulator [Spirosoma panaciterrae]
MVLTTKPSTDERIVTAAMSLFLRYSYSRVTVDDIVRELAMSKKTIYNHFPNKSAILLACIDSFVRTFRQQAEAILGNSELSLREKLSQYLRHIGLSFTRVSPEFMQDIRRSEPQAWERLCTYRRDVVLRHLSTLMDEGVAAGYIRDEASRHLAILAYIGAMEQLDDPDFVAQFPAAFVQSVPAQIQERADQLIKLLLYGLLTPAFWEAQLATQQYP